MQCRCSIQGMRDEIAICEKNLYHHLYWDFFPLLIYAYHTRDTQCPIQPPNTMNYADKVSVSTTQQISTPSTELLIWDSTCSATPVSWTGLSSSSTHRTGHRSLLTQNTWLVSSKRAQNYTKNTLTTREEKKTFPFFSRGL